MLFLVCLAWAGFELTTSVVISTDCISSCKSNCHYHHDHDGYPSGKQHIIYVNRKLKKGEGLLHATSTWDLKYIMLVDRVTYLKLTSLPPYIADGNGETYDQKTSKPHVGSNVASKKGRHFVVKFVVGWRLSYIV